MDVLFKVVAKVKQAKYHAHDDRFMFFFVCR